MKSVSRFPLTAASAFFFSSSVFVLGHALQMSNGFWHPLALKWLTAALQRPAAVKAAPKRAA